MQIPKIFNLGEFAMGEALYSNAPLAKQALAGLLATSRPTIQRYEAIAYREVSDFRLDYPELPREQWKIRKSSRDRTVPLSTYQIWVISIIQAIFKTLKKESSTATFLKDNPYLLSRAKYESRLRELAKVA